MITGNKGEWSELYTVIKLIADGELYQSDMSLNKNKDNVYQVIKVYKDENIYHLEFCRNDVINIFKVLEKAELIATYSIEEFKAISELLLNEINIAKGNSFRIVRFEEFLNDIQVKRLSAESKSKADIRLRIYDHRLAKETDLGFSIKSLLGNDSTIHNAGLGNNFIYKITAPKKFDVAEFNRSTYKPAKGVSKITYRLQKLEEMGCKIEFDHIQSHQLSLNLKMIDGDLPELLAWALYYRWLYREASLSSVADILEEKDPLNYYDNQPNEQKLYEYKLKRYLAETTMGMTSETPWHGEYNAFGGVIIVKTDGEIVCFHIYDFNIFRNYLIANTRFEQPATSEDENNPGNPRPNAKKKFFYGWLYEENGNLYLKISLQVRFK